MSEEVQEIETTAPPAEPAGDQGANHVVGSDADDAAGGDTEDLAGRDTEDTAGRDGDQRLALLEAIIYAAEEPLDAKQIAEGLQRPIEQVAADLARLVEEGKRDGRGVEVREVAGGYKMFTKAEHHEAVRIFVKSLRPRLKLSLPALETLAVVAYKQPITLPEIQAVRGVSATGVVHTLLKHKLITTAGRKKVVGKPMMYRTTRDFLVQFGLKDLDELPNLKELEELSRAALGEADPEPETLEALEPVEEAVDEPAEEPSESES